MLDTLRLCMHAAVSDQFWKRVKEVNMWCFPLLQTIIIDQHHTFMCSRQTLLLADFKVIVFEILDF